MSELPYRQIGSQTHHGIVAVCDHASNFVPEDIELGIAADLLKKHIAWDIGTAGVVDRMARRHDIPAYLAQISRLVVDLHREEDSPGLIPVTTDGHLIPGNIGANKEGRLNAYYRPYHDAMASWLDARSPGLILSIHSFTPVMESDPAQRPWELALLYNQDDRAAQLAIRLFGELGVTVGENEPYSGKQFNATMNRHAEARNIPYCAIEIRNDLITTEAGQARYAAMIADVAGRVLLALDSN